MAFSGDVGYSRRMRRELPEYILLGSALIVFVGGLCYLAYALMMSPEMAVYASEMGLR